MTGNGIAVSDFKGLHSLKLQAKDDAEKALPEVAKQFEAIFLQSMLKSMRLGQHFIEENSPFRGQYQEQFQGMLDAQYANNIAEGKGVGLATMLANQLSKTANEQPAARPITSAAQAMPIVHSEPIAPALHLPQTQPKVRDATTAGTIDEFVKSIWPYARQAASLIGLDPKILMAQAALETGWGHNVTKDSAGNSSNNLFNIKSSSREPGQSVLVKTTEYVADTPIKTQAAFKKYSSVENSFADYIELVRGDSRYEQALANTSDPQRYIKALHHAGYATDPNYSDKILSIYNGGELQEALERNGIKD